MRIEEVTLRPFHDVKEYDEVKANPFIEWSKLFEGGYYIPYKNDKGEERKFYVCQEMTTNNKIFTVSRLTNKDGANIVHAGSWSYPRDMLLVKGVDYE